MDYPSKKWLLQRLRNNLTKPMKSRVFDSFIIDNEENKSFYDDLVVGVVISNRKNITSLKFSENYHSSFTNLNQKPKWGNRIIDFQFYYQDDKELDSIPKVEIS